MASSPITSRQIDGEKVETVTEFIFLGFKITVASDCSQWLWCWRRLLRVPWTARRSNQWILKEINPEYLLKWLMMQLKFQYFSTCSEETIHCKRSWCCERLNAGEEGNRESDGWMALPSQWTWVWASSRRWWRSGKPGGLQSMGSQRVRHQLVTEQQHQPEALLNHITTTIHTNACSVTLHCSHILSR